MKHGCFQQSTTIKHTQQQQQPTNNNNNNNINNGFVVVVVVVVAAAAAAVVVVVAGWWGGVVCFLFFGFLVSSRYAGELAAMRENKRKFRGKMILGHASHWFLGRAMNSWREFVNRRREEKAKMRNIIYAMTQCRLRAAINKWRTTMREVGR